MDEMKTAADLSRLLLDQIADKWTILVLGAICAEGGKARFNALKRNVSGVSQKSLSRCLRRLERSGLVERRILDTSPLGVEYSATALGSTLSEPFGALYDWAKVHLQDVVDAQSHFDARARANTDR